MCQQKWSCQRHDFNNIQNQLVLMQIEDYVKAGKIAGEVRENVRQKDWIGSTLEEICEYVESEIRFLKFMLKNARYQQNSMLKEIIR